MFHVTAMGHPPAETSETSLAFLGSINMFGGPLEQAPKASKGKINSHNNRSETTDIAAIGSLP